MARRYDNNFKNMIVQFICVEKRSTMKIAKQFDIPLKTVENWVTAYNKNKFIFDDNYISKEQLIKKLKAENAILKKNNDILKKTILLINQENI